MATDGLCASNKFVAQSYWASTPTFAVVGWLLLLLPGSIISKSIPHCLPYHWYTSYPLTGNYHYRWQVAACPYTPKLWIYFVLIFCLVLICSTLWLTLASAEFEAVCIPVSFYYGNQNWSAAVCTAVPFWLCCSKNRPHWALALLDADTGRFLYQLIFSFILTILFSIDQ